MKKKYLLIPVIMALGLTLSSCGPVNNQSMSSKSVSSTTNYDTYSDLYQKLVSKAVLSGKEDKSLISSKYDRYRYDFKKDSDGKFSFSYYYTYAPNIKELNLNVYITKGNTSSLISILIPSKQETTFECSYTNNKVNKYSIDKNFSKNDLISFSSYAEADDLKAYHQDIATMGTVNLLNETSAYIMDNWIFSLSTFGFTNF